MIIEYRSKAKRHVRGTNVQPNQTLYAIKKGNYYFIWSYSNRAMAEYIDTVVEPGQTWAGVSAGTDIAANWRTSTDQLVPTDRRR